MNYNKVNFENLPSTKTPINADNLNNIQTNTEEALNELENLILNNPGGQSVGGGDTLPIGVILPHGSSTIPTGYLECNGQLVSRTDYSELFEIIGTAWGEGDGSTTFAVPDMRKRVPVGLDTSDEDFDTIGKTGGEKEHTLTVDEMPNHKHNTERNAVGGSGTVAGFMWGTNMADWGGQSTTYTGGGQPHNIMQPYTVTCYIIKAKKVSDYTPADTLPLGSIVEYDGDTVPDGYEEYTGNNITTGAETPTNEYVDGKQVFVKRIDCGALPNASSKNIELGIDFTNLTLIRMSGSTKNEAGNLNYPLPFSWSNIAEQVGILINGTKLTLSTSIDKSNFTQTYLDLYYTKNDNLTITYEDNPEGLGTLLVTLTNLNEEYRVESNYPMENVFTSGTTRKYLVTGLSANGGTDQVCIMISSADGHLGIYEEVYTYSTAD